ncbi:MAG: DUF2232 domain-containing protein, partial [bacterium]|nr:DUF2232 domain-containing protein [bacterium]
EESPKDKAGLWLRLLGFALLPLTVQAFQPAIGGALGIMVPLPLAYGMTRRGYLEGTAAVSFIGLLTSFILGAGQGFYFLLETLPLCVGIRWTVRFRGPLYRPVLTAVVMVGLFALAAATLYGAATDTAPGELYRQAIKSMGLFVNDMSGSSGLSDQEQKQVLWMVELWQRMFVGIWLATLLLLVTFYSLLVRGWMIAAGAMEDDGSALLSRWKLPFPFVFSFILVASLVLLTTGTARDVALNALVPLAALYGIQGVVVAGHMFTLWALPSFFRVMVLAFGIIAFPLWFMVMVALIGLFDTWINFRQRWPLQMPPPPVT